jgi:hypothetical protein
MPESKSSYHRKTVQKPTVIASPPIDNTAELQNQINALQQQVELYKHNADQAYAQYRDLKSTFELVRKADRELIGNLEQQLRQVLATIRYGLGAIALREITNNLPNGGQPNGD